jgi:tetratricopeptide (TPR) repeat protein
VRTEPASPQTWRRLAVSHGRAGRHVEAIELAEAALARDPSIHPALIPLVEEVLNIAPGAVWSLLETMRRLAPEDVQYMHLAGVVGAKAGRGEEAFELMREAVRRRAEEPTWWYALGRALQAEGGRTMTRRAGTSKHFGECLDRPDRARRLQYSAPGRSSAVHGWP